MSARMRSVYIEVERIVAALDASNELKLVRIWDRNYDNLLGQAFVTWDRGFTVAADDPIAVTLWRAADDERARIPHITVERTTELAWYIDRMDMAKAHGKHGELTVSCRPLRDLMLPDAYLVWLWLHAENNWLAASQ